MMEFMEKKEMLDLKQQGVSNRETARRLGVSRKTVAKYWNGYKRQISQLDVEDADTRAIQDDLYKTPKYKPASRKARKYTEKMAKRLEAILAAEHRELRSNQKSDRVSYGYSAVYA